MTGNHIGGSRAIAAVSDHHAARPVFQSASVLIAESALENCQVQAGCATPILAIPVRSRAQLGKGRRTNQEVAFKVGERFYRPLPMHPGLRVRGWLLNLTTYSPARGPGATSLEMVYEMATSRPISFKQELPRSSIQPH